MRIKIKEIIQEPEKFLDKENTKVCGWARTVRVMKGPMFIDLSDGSCFEFLQVVVSKKVSQEKLDLAKNSGGPGASFRITGTLVKSPAAGQEFEFLASDIEVLGTVEDPATYPLAKTKHEHSNEFLRTVAHLRPRTNFTSSVARIRNACAFATHKFFNERSFIYVHTPIITGSDCEGAGEMFKVTTLNLNDKIKQLGDIFKDYDPDTDDEEGYPCDDDMLNMVLDFKKKISQPPEKDFFSKDAYLTVSGQLNVETYACALSDVYTFGPTFRAENSNTSRHLSEFWMIEPEICFATLKDDMDLAEAYIKYVTKYVVENCASDLKFFNEKVEEGLLERLDNVLNTDFTRITYSKAIEVLEKDVSDGKVTFEDEIIWGMDLGSVQEKYLTELYKGPVILTNYPKDIKAFYMKVSKDDPRTVEAMDILVPKIGELVGGSAREENLEILDKRIEEMSLKIEDFSWYRDLRRYGSVPHAGFGVGFERLVMFMTGVKNIRDVIPFPRWPGNCDF